MPTAPRKPLLVNLAWAVALVIGLPTVYVMSYAPVFSLTRGPSASDIPAYRPVDWLIDNTPFRPLLFNWADLWGVGDDFRFNHDWRTLGWPYHHHTANPLP